MTIAQQIAAAVVAVNAWLLLRLAWAAATLTDKPEDPDMLITFDGTRVKLFIFQRGTKVMRIYANDLADAQNEAMKLHFNPPYESVTIPAGQNGEECEA